MIGRNPLALGVALLLLAAFAPRFPTRTRVHLGSSASRNCSRKIDRLPSERALDRSAQIGPGHVAAESDLL